MDEGGTRRAPGRFAVAVLVAVLLVAGGMSWLDSRQGYEVWNSCPSDDPLSGPNGERYHRARMKECKFVDESGNVVDTDADGNELCKEQDLDVPCAPLP